MTVLRLSIGHAFVDYERSGTRWRSVCCCGWTSPLSYGVAATHREWRLHRDTTNPFIRYDLLNINGILQTAYGWGWREK